MKTNGNNYQQKKNSQSSPKTVVSQMNLPAVDDDITPSPAHRLLPIGSREALLRISLIPLTLDSCLAGTFIPIVSSEEARTLPGKVQC